MNLWTSWVYLQQIFPWSVMMVFLVILGKLDSSDHKTTFVYFSMTKVEIPITENKSSHWIPLPKALELVSTFKDQFVLLLILWTVSIYTWYWIFTIGFEIYNHCNFYDLIYNKVFFDIISEILFALLDSEEI